MKRCLSCFLVLGRVQKLQQRELPGELQRIWTGKPVKSRIRRFLNIKLVPAWFLTDWRRLFFLWKFLKQGVYRLCSGCLFEIQLKGRNWKKDLGRFGNSNFLTVTKALLKTNVFSFLLSLNFSKLFFETLHEDSWPFWIQLQSAHSTWVLTRLNWARSRALFLLQSTYQSVPVGHSSITEMVEWLSQKCYSMNNHQYLFSLFRLSHYIYLYIFHVIWYTVLLFVIQNLLKEKRAQEIGHIQTKNIEWVRHSVSWDKRYRI